MSDRLDRVRDIKAFRQRLLRNGYKEVHINSFYNSDEMDYFCYLYCKDRFGNVIERQYPIFLISCLPAVKIYLP